ncbi:MAG: hypothetical protein ACTSWR_09015 [Candidatus Helarchaeota archaeon]
MLRTYISCPSRLALRESLSLARRERRIWIPGNATMPPSLHSSSQ